MFDKSYPFKKLFVKDFRKNGHGYLVSKTTYTFRTEASVDYLIEVEEYQSNIFIIKFCPKKLKKHPKRFNILTGEHIMPRIVGTCIQVMLSIIKKNNLASFGFLGSNTIVFGKYSEGKEDTKRYRIYKYVVQNYIGEETFSHKTDKKNSTYLVINRNNGDCELIASRANKMFDSIFPSLTD